MYLFISDIFGPQDAVFGGEHTCPVPVILHWRLLVLKGQSHEKFGKMRVWGVSLGPN
jgi:hypothetical protein